MNAVRTALVLATLLVSLVPAVGADHSPDPDRYYFTRINVTHENPRDMTVVIVPPAYFSQSAMIENIGWVGANALLDAPGTRAALEATTYWAWMIDQYEDQYPQLARFTFTTKVLGVDATAADLQSADILIMTGMAADPVPFVFHLGLGLPTYPTEAFFFNQGGQRVCTVWNTGVGQNSAGDATVYGAIGDVGDAMREAGSPVWFNRVDTVQDLSPTRTRNLVLHEFGHCLGAGHMGESLGLAHTNSEGVDYENHPNDILSVAFGHYRQCLSNANVLSLAEGYAWLTSDTATWEQHDKEAYLLKDDYVQVCLPTGLHQY